MQVTITLKQYWSAQKYTLQEGIPEVIPVEACYLGWQESLSLLKLLIEADIPDQ